jgi:hypothetical protein
MAKNPGKQKPPSKAPKAPPAKKRRPGEDPPVAGQMTRLDASPKRKAITGANQGSRTGRQGGRAKGTPNQRTTDLQERLRAVMLDLFGQDQLVAKYGSDDWDPVIAMAVMAESETDLVLSEKITLLKEVGTYWHAKRKAVETSDTKDNAANTFADIAAAAEQAEDGDTPAPAGNPNAMKGAVLH